MFVQCVECVLIGVPAGWTPTMRLQTTTVVIVGPPGSIQHVDGCGVDGGVEIK